MSLALAFLTEIRFGCQFSIGQRSKLGNSEKLREEVYLVWPHGKRNKTKS